MEFFSDGHLEAVQQDTKATLLDNLACISHEGRLWLDSRAYFLRYRSSHASLRASLRFVPAPRLWRGAGTYFAPIRGPTCRGPNFLPTAAPHKALRVKAGLPDRATLDAPYAGAIPHQRQASRVLEGRAGCTGDRTVHDWSFLGPSSSVPTWSIQTVQRGR